MRNMIGFLGILFLLGIQPTFSQNRSVNNPSVGWNTRQLVSLYFHNSELQTQWAYEVLSKHQLRGDENILDFGSGVGNLTAYLSFLVPYGKVTGVDISKEMVFYASKMFPSTYYKNLSFATSSDANLSKSPSSHKFDIVTSFCMFHLVPNPSKVIANVKKHMTADGKWIITLPIWGNREFYRAVAEEMETRGWQPPSITSEVQQQMRNPEKVQDMFVKAGFDIDYFQVVPLRVPFSSREEMVDWFEGTLAANWNVPEKGRREFFMALADKYLKYRPQDQDEDHFVYFSLNRIDMIVSPDTE